MALGAGDEVGEAVTVGFAAVAVEVTDGFGSDVDVAVGVAGTEVVGIGNAGVGLPAASPGLIPRGSVARATTAKDRTTGNDRIRRTDRKAFPGGRSDRSLSYRSC